jgi:hypothetical protein
MVAVLKKIDQSYKTQIGLHHGRPPAPVAAGNGSHP